MITIQLSWLGSRKVGCSVATAVPARQLRCLNLGCGRRVRPGWQNVDAVASAPSVQKHNLLEGIPYPDNSFDVAYHSHLLEHFPRKDAPQFLKECHRVLASGGILRVVVPDLENIVRNYLRALEFAKRGKAGWNANYDWMVLELYDQAVRSESGGGWNAYLCQDPLPNWEFVQQRTGVEAREMLAVVRSQRATGGLRKPSLPSKLHFAFTHFPRVLKNKWTHVLLSKADYDALQLGRFRRGGEIHQWMYDSYSLARLLREAGFQDPRKMSATQSAIPNWPSHCLDNEPDGSICKPDSLFMEARKP